MRRQWWKVYAVTLSLCFLILALACVLQPISWSPDGRWIALTRWIPDKNSDSGKPAAGELWIVSPSPIERRRLLVTSATMLGGPAWEQDGKGMYVVELPEEKTTGPTTLRWIPLDGKPREILRLPATREETGNAAFSSPAISPDGKRVAFVWNKQSVVVARTDGKLDRVIEVEDAGTVLWSHDGRWLVATGGDDNKPAVRFFDTRSSETFLLDVRFRTMAWLPDGRRFVAVKEQSGEGKNKSSIAVLEGVAGPREVASFDLDVKPAGPLVLSRQGDAAFFTREEEGEQLPAICKLDLRDGKFQVIYESLGPVCAWSVSPNGRSLAFRESAIGKDSGGDSFIGVLDLRGTTEPIYLALDDKQWATTIKAYTEELKKTAPEKITPGEERKISRAVAQVERLLAAFRRDFPQSPLLGECAKAVKEVRTAFKQAGIGLSPGGGTPQW